MRGRAHEKARNTHMVSIRSLLLATTALYAAMSLAPARAQPAPNAQPVGGQVVAGTASILQSAGGTTITQSSARAAINWRGFDVGRNQGVTFRQPDASAATLNRVIGPDPSAIAGRINANGQVIITNPSGVVFYPGAQVEAASVIASVPGMTNQDFMAGKLALSQPGRPGAGVVNAGTLTARQAGLVGLVAPAVANSGVIRAQLGHVVLAGAQAATLDLYGDGLVSIDVTRKVQTVPLGADGRPVSALVTNTGTVLAPGGTVQLTTAAADGVVQDLVNAGGTIAADTVGARTGTVVVAGTGGNVIVQGRIAARGQTAGQAGGAVAVNATGTVTVAGSAAIDVSGRTHGGTVTVGTTLARAVGGPGVKAASTARSTVIDAGARITADGGTTGHGGRVTVLSLDGTHFAGQVSARGGSVAGDGGAVEISGHALTLRGHIDVGATNGAPGSILIDPASLTIGTAEAQVLEGMTGNIVLQAGSITVAASVVLKGAAQTMELDAGGSMTVNAGTTLQAFSLILHAADSAVQGFFDPAGSLTLLGTLTATSALTLSSGTGGMTLAGDWSALNVNATTTGNLFLGAAPAETAAFAVVMSAPNRGRITLFGQTATAAPSSPSGSAIFSAGGNIIMSSSDTLQVGSDTSLAMSAGVRAPGVPRGPGSIDLAGTLIAGNDLVSLTAGTGGIVLSGQITTGSLHVDATGAITQISGSLSAGTLDGNAGGNVRIGSTTGGSASIDTLGSFTVTSSSFALIDSAPLTIAGNVQVAASLNLETAGSIRQTAGVINTTSLSGSAASVALGQANNIVILGGFTTTAGGFSLTEASGQSLVINGPVVVPQGQAIALFADTMTGSGALSAPGGLIQLAPSTAGHPIEIINTSSADAGQLAILVGQNAFGGFSVENSVAATIEIGDTQAGAVTIGHPGDLIDFAHRGSSVAGGAFGDVILATQAGISEPASRLDTLSLQLFAGASANLGANNAVDTLGSSSVGGSLSLADAKALTVTGPVVAGNIGLSVAGAVTFAGNISTGQLNIASAGSILQTFGQISAGTLDGSAGGNVQLGTSASSSAAIGTLGAFTVFNGAFELIDTGSLTVAGPLRVVAVPSIGAIGSITLASFGDMRIAGNILNAGSFGLIGLSATGHVTQDAGSVINAGTFGSVSISSGGGTGDGGSGPGGITLAGQVIAPDGFVALAAGQNGIALSGDISTLGSGRAETFLDMNTTGPITQSAGVINTGSLSGNAAAVALDQANHVDALLAFTTTAGGFSLTEASGQALAINGPVSVPQGQTIALFADTMTGSGALTAPGGLIQLAPVTPNQPVEIISTGSADAGQLAILAGENASGGFSVENSNAATIEIGDAQAGAMSVGHPADVIDFVHHGSSLPGGAFGDVILASRSGISEPAAVLNTPTLQLATGGSAILGANNTIVALGSSDVGGLLLLADATSLTISGPIVAGDMQLAVTGATTLAGDIFTNGLGIASTGEILQTAGRIVAETLQGRAGTGVQLGTASGTSAAIAALESFIVSAGTFALTDASALTINGRLAAPIITVSATDTVTLNGGTIATAGLPSTSALSARASLPASTISVLAGPDGKAHILQLGTTTLASLDGGAVNLTLALPAQGGTMSFADLVGPGASVVLATGSGTATGPVDLGNLLLVGAGGSADLRGSVQGVSGPAAALDVRILPATDPAYRFNGCEIAVGCVVVPPPPPRPPNPPGAIAIARLARAATPAMLYPLVSMDQQSGDTTDIMPQRVPARRAQPPQLALRVAPPTTSLRHGDPDVILPNISDRDY